MHRVQHAKYFESLEDQLIEASKTLEMQRLELEALRATVKKDKENRILVQGFSPFFMFVCTCVVSHRHCATHYRNVHMCISCIICIICSMYKYTYMHMCIQLTYITYTIYTHTRVYV